MSGLSFLNALAETKTPYNLGAGVPPIDLYPKLDCVALLSKYDLKEDHLILGYHRTSGFITEIAGKTIEKRDEVKVDNQKIFVTNGVQEAIILSLVLFKNKTVACIEPFYTGFYDAAVNLGIKPLLLKRENLVEQISSLPNGSMIYICTDFDNPSGECIDMKSREAIALHCKRNEIYIFEDCTYREFFLTDKNPPSLFHLMQEQVIFALSFSKILAPGLRTAFVAVPLKLKDEFGRAKANFSLNNSGITQAIVAAWLREQNFNLSQHLKLAKARLAKNHDLVSTFSATDNPGGFFRILSFNRTISFEDCQQLLDNEGVAVCPMSLFQGPDIQNKSIRISIATVETENLKVALNKIYEFWS